MSYVGRKGVGMPGSVISVYNFIGENGHDLEDPIYPLEKQTT